MALTPTQDAIARYAQTGGTMTWLELHAILKSEGTCFTLGGKVLAPNGRGMCSAIGGTYRALKRDGRLPEAWRVAEKYTDLNGHYAWKADE